MATMTRFVPFRSAMSDMAVLQNRLNSIFSDFAQPSFGGPAEQESLAAGNFVPAVDVYEDEGKLVLHVEVPGIKQEDLDVRVENNILTIRGERKLDSERKEENYRRVERRFGSFVRSWTLPQTINQEAVSASFNNGVLEVTLLKKEAAKPRSVKIDVGSAQSQQGQIASPEAKVVEAAR